MRLSRIIALVAAAAVLLPAPAQRRKKNSEEEPPTQVLELPKELPAAVVGDAGRLVFHVTPLSAKGLLTQQVRDALSNLNRQLRGATVLRLRAFVAGSGDMRRVNALVSETFTDRRQPLPAISVVRVGGLPLVGAQVVLESTAMSRRAVNSHGVLFISGQMASGKSPLDPVMPLAVQSLDSLVKAVRLGGSKEAEVLSCTCFISGLEGFSKIRVEAAHRFPKASFNVVQLTREPSNALAECEAVARAGAPLAGGGRVFSPEGLPQSPNYSQIAAVAPGKLVLSGLQMGFGREETDTRLAFERLEKALEPVGGKLASTVFSRIYPVSGAAAERVRKVRFEFFRKETPPASTMLVFEGVPSLDATFGLDVITAGQ